MNRPEATSRISASSSQLSHSRRTASTYSAASSNNSVTTSGECDRPESAVPSSGGKVRRPKCAASSGRAETRTRTPARPELT
ncbi:hypothetical protein M2266_000390 [Streptomyces sp. SPB162]|nr:hypothetical protein [Streptomyces sp. SPB162]